MSAILAFICFHSAHGDALAPANDFERFHVGPLAPWMIRFTDDSKPRLRIESLMKELKLNRLQAVELQNHFLDGYDKSAPISDIHRQFDSAIARVRAGEFESQTDLKAIATAPFTVVFDLDATLYDQTLSEGNTCAEISYSRGTESKKVIKLAPGWETIFEKILKLNGKIVLFSANKDEETLMNLSNWMWRGQSLYDLSTRKIHPDLSGILTNHHLVRQAADEAEGAVDRKRGTVISEPSKDLRIFDENLRKVIIVDDNPSRLFQMQNTRVVEKFNGRKYCEVKTKSDAVSKLSLARFEGTLPRIGLEIEKAAKRMKKYEFTQAFLPYSYFGALTLRSFAETRPQLSRTKLEELIVENPDLVRDRY